MLILWVKILAVWMLSVRPNLAVFVLPMVPRLDNKISSKQIVPRYADFMKHPEISLLPWRMATTFIQSFSNKDTLKGKTFAARVVVPLKAFDVNISWSPPNKSAKEHWISEMSSCSFFSFSLLGWHFNHSQLVRFAYLSKNYSPANNQMLLGSCSCSKYLSSRRGKKLRCRPRKTANLSTWPCKDPTERFSRRCHSILNVDGWNPTSSLSNKSCIYIYDIYIYMYIYIHIDSIW